MPAAATGEVCWLDVAAPFVVVDASQELTTDILLTATCFPGVDGYRDTHNATQYQILLYDSTGKEMEVANAMMIVSALHLDYERRDLALEHGSDRHSTFQDFKC